jgi:hypothetical protein
LKNCTARSCFCAAARLAKVPRLRPPAGLCILLARIEPVLAGGELADHGAESLSLKLSVTENQMPRIRSVVVIAGLDPAIHGAAALHD